MTFKGPFQPKPFYDSVAHLQCLVLQLELLILVRVALRELVDADAIVVDLLPDLEADGPAEGRALALGNRVGSATQPRCPPRTHKTLSPAGPPRLDVMDTPPHPSSP